MHLLTNQNLLEKTDWIFVFQIFGYQVHRFHPLCYFQYFFSQIDMNESKNTMTIWVLLLVSRIQLIWCDSQQLENTLMVLPWCLLLVSDLCWTFPPYCFVVFKIIFPTVKSVGNIHKINFWKHNWMIAQLKWKTKKCSFRFWKISSFLFEFRIFSEYNHLSWLCRLL